MNACRVFCRVVAVRKTCLQIADRRNGQTILFGARRPMIALSVRTRSRQSSMRREAATEDRVSSSDIR
jgi:hypothetical protein